MPKGCISIPVDRHSDDRGELSVLTNNLPENFQLSRIYYVKNLPNGLKRGVHAHRVQTQVLFVLKGEITVIIDDGKDNYTMVISEKSSGLLIGPLTWCTIDTRDENSIYIIIANGPYNQSEYITDYGEFKHLRQWFK